MKTIFVLFLIVFRLPAFSQEAAPVTAREIDRLLAAVNGRVITESDLKTAGTLNAVLELGRTQAPMSREEELDRLIIQELIRQEMENFPIPQQDRERVKSAVQSRIEYLKSAYLEIGGLPALLRQLGLEEEDLVSRIHLIEITIMFSDLRFGPFISVSRSEVEDYYQGKLVPEQKLAGLTVPPEKATEIETYLKEVKKNALMFQWIENIRSHSKIEHFADGPSKKERT